MQVLVFFLLKTGFIPQNHEIDDWKLIAWGRICFCLLTQSDSLELK